MLLLCHSNARATDACFRTSPAYDDCRHCPANAWLPTAGELLMTKVKAYLALLVAAAAEDKKEVRRRYLPGRCLAVLNSHCAADDSSPRIYRRLTQLNLNSASRRFSLMCRRKQRRSVRGQSSIPSSRYRGVHRTKQLLVCLLLFLPLFPIPRLMGPRQGWCLLGRPDNGQSTIRSR